MLLVTKPPAGTPKYWVTPSSANKLLSCLASLTYLPTSTPSTPDNSTESAGSLAHKALQLWINEEHWKSADNDQKLPELYRRCADQLGLTIAKLPSGRQTEARLGVRAPALGALLRDSAGTDGVVHSECTMYDHSRKLWGTIDVMVTRDDQVSLLLDLKTGNEVETSQVPASVAAQLTFYAGLVEQNLRVLPQSTAVFSLRRGLTTVSTTADEITRLHHTLGEARTKWTQMIRPAKPGLTNCQYCRLRFSCEPHWKAIQTWENTDAVQGRILQVEISASATAAVLLNTPTGKRWLTGVPATVVAKECTGKWLRAVRLKVPESDSPGDLPAVRMHEQSEARLERDSST